MNNARNEKMTTPRLVECILIQVLQHAFPLSCTSITLKKDSREGKNRKMHVTCVATLCAQLTLETKSNEKVYIEGEGEKMAFKLTSF